MLPGMGGPYPAKVVIDPSLVPGKEVDAYKLDPHIRIILDVAFNVLLGSGRSTAPKWKVVLLGDRTREATAISGFWSSGMLPGSGPRWPAGEKLEVGGVVDKATDIDVCTDDFRVSVRWVDMDPQRVGIHPNRIPRDCR